jgi:hypothetical protein
VTDAGDPVAGAKVKVKGGKSGKTGSRGTVTIKVAAGKHSAGASATGYASASLRFKAK